MSSRYLAPAGTFARSAWRDAGDRVRHDARDRAPRVTDASDHHLESTLGWLTRAQDRSPSGGVSYGYSLRGGWLPPYRETSGYILTTLYRAADQLGEQDYRARAERVARWLVAVQNADGSFANPRYGPNGIVFDTGQCLFGLVAAFERTADEVFLNAAVSAGSWLVGACGQERMWKRAEHNATAHTYNSRTAWALLRLNQVAPSQSLVTAARSNLDWALENQTPSGFFTNNAFVEGSAPYTHNISYAICGLQESGWLLDDSEYVDSARRCSDAVLRLMRSDGFIPGQIRSDGGVAASYACLTGQSQLAIVWAKQFDRTGDRRYQVAAGRALRFVKNHHRVVDANPDVQGAVAGSFPIWGRYAPLSYPNWAAKFFVDALLLERQW
ncbi:MAG: hypothetical protein ABI662_01500 [Dermatophilaceae bacterium]